MANTFYSKSASRQKHNKKGLKTHIIIKDAVEKAVYTANSILWIGKDLNDLFTYGANFKFNCLWLDNKDLSSLIHAKCLIFSYADMFGRTLQALNFACEYGIPTLWLHRYAPPETASWSFDVMTDKKHCKHFWEIVCHLAT